MFNEAFAGNFIFFSIIFIHFLAERNVPNEYFTSWVFNKENFFTRHENEFGIINDFLAQRNLKMKV